MKRILLPIIALVAGFNTAMAVDDNTVEIVYNGTSATVSVASNISSYITNNSSGSHVKLVQSSSWSGNSTGEITYILSGSSANGEFYLEGSYKCTVQLAGLTLTNPSGPAVNIQNGKRIDISVKKDTNNTLTDGANDDYKGCLHCKGHAEFKGKGTLTVVGNSRHGIYCKEYMELKNCTLNITAAKKDGIHCKEYFLMESGTVNISGVEDDGIQVELSGTTSTGKTTDHDDEDSGNFYMETGTLTIDVYTNGGDHVKADGDITYGSKAVRNFTTSVPAGIGSAAVPTADGAVFDLAGRRLSPATAKGIRVMRQSDGTVKKVLK